MNRVRIQHYPTTATKHEPVGNTAAVATLAAAAGERHVIDRVFWSYDTTPTGGGLQLVEGSTQRLDFTIPAAGPNWMDVGYVAAVGSAVEVTLAAGGGSVIGQLTVFSHKVTD